MTVLAGDWDCINTPEQPDHIRPRESEWKGLWKEGGADYSFPAYSFTVMRFEGVSGTAKLER